MFKEIEEGRNFRWQGWEVLRLVGGIGEVVFKIRVVCVTGDGFER